MATMDGNDPESGYYQSLAQPAQPTTTSQGPPPPQSGNAGNPPWLPQGAALNPDGSITMPNGSKIPAPPSGSTRDPNTGVLTFSPGTKSGPQGQVGAADVPMATAPPPTPSTTSGGNPSANQSNNGQGLFDPSLYAQFTGKPPTYTPPVLPQAPQWKTPPAFSYGDFKAPTLEEAQNQPGYQFGVQQGEQALQQSRAAQGLLRTGGTLKDILNYGQQAATQNYGNVLNQDQGIYNTNRAGAVQAYNTNYQTQYVDPYQAQVLPWQTEAANAQHVADQSYNNAWNAYTNSEDLFFNNENSRFGKYLSLAQLGAANA